MKARWIFLFAILLAAIFTSFAKSMTPQSPTQCLPSEVKWNFQGVPVRSFGCVSIANDSLYITAHLFQGVARGTATVAKDDVVEVIVYTPSKVFKTSKAND